MDSFHGNLTAFLLAPIILQEFIHIIILIETVFDTVSIHGSIYIHIGDRILLKVIFDGRLGVIVVALRA